MDVVIMEIVSFVNEQPLGEININDEDIPITPNMLATGPVTHTEYRNYGKYTS